MKKRVKKNIRKGKQKKNIFMNDKFLLSILLLGLIIVGLSITIYYKPVSENYVGDGSLAESSSSTNFFDDYIINTDFYKTIRSYIVPDVEATDTYAPFPWLSEFSLFVIGIITLIILFVVIYDIFTLIPVFNQSTMRIIAIGLGIVMILLRVNVFFASIIFTWGIAIFAGFGSLAVGGVIILAIILLFALFFGGNKFVEYLGNIRSMRENLERKEKAKRAGGRIKALEEEAKAAGV